MDYGYNIKMLTVANNYALYNCASVYSRNQFFSNKWRVDLSGIWLPLSPSFPVRIILLKLNNFLMPTVSDYRQANSDSREANLQYCQEFL